MAITIDNETSCDSIVAAITATKPMIEPTDRSSAPIAMTNVIPRLTIADMDALTIIPSIFNRDRNLPLIAVNTIATTTRAMRDVSDSDLSTLLNI